MTELELLQRLLPYLSPAGGELVIGAGEDDVAAWRESDGTYTVASCDTAIEGVHFDLSRQQAEDVGWRALAFALSDLAAKGATPRYGLAAIAVPRRWPPEVAPAIYAGMAGLAAQVGLRIVGGDTSAAPSDGSLTLSVLGRTSHRPQPRSAARAGWKVAVTGPLGGASESTRPRPRLELGRELARTGLVCGDISDGLVRELDKVSAAAGVGARLQIELVPLAPGATAEQAIASGEEVELVCLGPADTVAGLTVVGELTADARVAVVDSMGREVQVAQRGYDHFA